MFEESKEKLGIWAADKVQQERDRRGYFRLFFISLGANTLIWITAFAAPALIGEAVEFAIDVEGRVLTYLSVIPFVSGFIMMYAACKLKRQKTIDSGKVDEGFMSGYYNHLQRDSTRSIFLLAGMFGALNSIVLVFAIIWFR